MAASALVNGEFDHHPLIHNRGLAYGDGLFETIAVIDGKPRSWRAHMKRLHEGCRRLALAPPDASLLASEAQQLIAGRDPAVLKIIVTRGSGGRGYTPAEGVVNDRILQVFDWPSSYAEWRSQGIRAGLCSTPIGLNPQLAGIKHLNRLEQVLGARECALNSWAEGLLFNTEDELIGGTKTNVFVAFDSGLETPLLDKCGVHGVMRAQVLDLARALDIEITESRIQRARMSTAKEIFVTNAILGMARITCLDLAHPYGTEILEFDEFKISEQLQKHLFW